MNTKPVTQGLILPQRGVWIMEPLLDSETIPLVEWLYYCLLTDNTVATLEDLSELLTDGLTLHEELDDLYTNTHIAEIMEVMCKHYYPPTKLPWSVTDFTINGSVSLRLPGTLLLTYNVDNLAFKRFTGGP